MSSVPSESPIRRPLHPPYAAMFTTLAACLLFVGCSDKPTPAQSAFLEKIGTYRIEADSKPPAAVFQTIDRAIASAEPYDPASDDSARVIAYKASLDERGDDGDPTSAYYAGRDRSRTCRWMASHGNEAENIARCWQRALSAFKTASVAGLGAASEQIAVLLADGRAGKVSRPEVAAWYVTAASQYLKADDRNAASIAVSKALTQVPDDAAALRLQKTLTE